MTSTVPSYSKVYAVGHRAVANIFSGDVIVEEKVDGSQFSFGFIDGELRCRSRNVELNMHDPESWGMFKEGVNAVIAVQDHLVPGWVYRGEYLQKPKHNTLAYDRTPHNHIMLFDVMIGIEDYLENGGIVDAAWRLGFEPVPVLYRGKIDSVEQLYSFLEKTSVLGGQKIEGVVIKARDKFNPDGKMMAAKLVSEAFKEVHQGEWKDANPNRSDIVEHLIEKLRTPARWQKARQHLLEAGVLQGAPQDIPALMKEVTRDILQEEGDEIARTLFNHFWKGISKGVTRGLPEWYKQVLAEEAFDDLS